MKTMIQRWGNSLALRIPKAFAREISVAEGDEIELSVVKGRLVVTPRSSADYSLAELVARIRPGNVHKEVIAGARVGKEVW